MAKVKTKYRCTSCSQDFSKWQGQCSCGEWNTIEEIEEDIRASKNIKVFISEDEKPKKLKNIKTGSNKRIVTGISELDRVLGGGIVPDSVNVISAPPGAGKSTLLLMMANEIGNRGINVLYISGEESDSQIKGRADRVCNEISENIYIKHEKSMNRVEAYIREIDPEIIIIDSMQTMYVEEITDSVAGNPKQLNECTARLINISKNQDKKRACFVISQMNKDEEMMGTRSFEHAVDGVFYLEGDRNEQLRILSARKNRFGDAGETGLFLMEAEGLIPLENPSEFFVTKRDSLVAGCAITVTKEGTRNIVVEIESLVEKAFYGYPARIGEGINKQQLQILTAILEKRAGLTIGDKDVYVKVVGGLKLQETAVNLGVIMSIVSSLYNRGIPNDVVFIGEVGLTGEVKTVPSVETRIKEIDRLGFKKIFIPHGNLRKSLDLKNAKVIEVKSVNEAIKNIYGKE